MSLAFIGFVFIISSLVILYTDDYMFGDLNIIRFILLVWMFVVPIIFLIIIPDMMSILLGWNGLGLVKFWLSQYRLNTYQTTFELTVGIRALLPDATVVVWHTGGFAAGGPNEQGQSKG
jgi:NADH:ubiquinone oxidoreductase subunit 5 (subunit L)/multisubunit Na+/H+ antiporter MnhA subunit